MPIYQLLVYPLIGQFWQFTHHTKEIARESKRRVSYTRVVLTSLSFSENCLRDFPFSFFPPLSLSLSPRPCSFSFPSLALLRVSRGAWNRLKQSLKSLSIYCLNFYLRWLTVSSFSLSSLLEPFVILLSKSCFLYKQKLPCHIDKKPLAKARDYHVWMEDSFLHLL